MGEQNLPRFKAESGTGELMRGSFCEGEIGETALGRLRRRNRTFPQLKIEQSQTIPLPVKITH
jgi:hypothetical protein